MQVLPKDWGQADYDQAKVFFANLNVGEWIGYRGAVHVDPASESWCLTSAGGFQKAP